MRQLWYASLGDAMQGTYLQPELTWSKGLNLQTKDVAQGLEGVLIVLYLNRFGWEAHRRIGASHEIVFDLRLVH